METTDRLWWLEGLFGLGFAAAAVAFPMWMLSTMLPLDTGLGLPITPELLTGCALTTIFLILALSLAIASVPARVRSRRRAAALRARLDAMPLARLTADPAQAPDVSREPLVLSWRTTKSARYFVVYVFGFIINLALLLGDIGTLFFSNPAPDLLHLLLGAIALVVLVLAVTIGVVVARYIPTVFGRPYGVSADGEGISYRTELGGRRFLPWSDMRLLEVSSTDSPYPVVHHFRLYGSRVRVAWRDGPQSRTRVEPDGISADEMALRQRALLDLVAARTGLVPRTFSRALKAADPGAVPKAGAGESGALTTGVAFAVLIVIFLVPAAAVLLLPLTTSALFNEVMAAPLVLVALVLVVRGVMLTLRALARLQASAPESIPLPVAPPLDAPHTAYILTLRMPPLRRLSAALVGALLAIEIVPTLLAILPITTLHLLGMGMLPPVRGEPDYWLAFVLALFGLTGFASLYTATRGPTTIIRADAAGLSARLLKSTPSILPWDSIEDIAARMHRGQIAAYQAKGDVGRVTITWSAMPSRVAPGTPSGGALPISPDELAALVVKRSGKSLRLASQL